MYLLILILHFTLPSIYAAQNATIITESASIHARPTQDSPILETRSAKETIRISSQSVAGWYKVKATSGKFGWIYRTDIQIGATQTEHPSIREAPSTVHERRDQWRDPVAFIELGAVGAAVISPDINSTLLAQTYTYAKGPGAYLEFALAVSNESRLALRAMLYRANYSIVANNYNYQVVMTSIPIMFGYQYRWKWEYWDAGFGLYGGLSTFNDLAVTNWTAKAPNSFSVTENYAPSGMVNLSVSRSLTYRYWLVFQLGAYYSQARYFPIAGNFNGSELFYNGTSLKSLRPTQYGAIGSVALQMRLF